MATFFNNSLTSVSGSVFQSRSECFSFSFINVPQQKVPKLIINQGVIIGIYPGASSKEVEEQLTSKIENFIIRYNEVDKQKTYSHSKDGIMFIHVELMDELDDEFQFWTRMENELAELSLN